MTRLLTVVALAAVVCGGCGADGSDGQARTVDSTTTTSESGDTTIVRTEVSLDGVVLQLSDMPTGWSVSPAEDDESDDSFCEERDPFNEIEPQQEAESTFQQSDFGPFAISGASQYEDQDQAAEVMDLLTDMANACQAFTQIEDDGTETEYTIAALSFPDLGDDTFAFRMSGTTMFGPLNLDVAAVRRDSMVIALIHGGLGAVDSDLTESLIRTMVERT